MKKFKLGNKGISIESAILFMLVIFMFCSLITSYTVYRSYQVKIDKLQIESKIELDNIGEQFLISLKENIINDFKTSYPNKDKYNVLVNESSDINKITISHKKDVTNVLYIEAKIDNENNVQILKWCYKDTN